jgi:hypothetical protein
MAKVYKNMKDYCSLAKDGIFVIWRVDVFERIVVKRWQLQRQNLFMNVESGQCTWGDVKWV